VQNAFEAAGKKTALQEQNAEAGTPDVTDASQHLRNITQPSDDGSAVRAPIRSRSVRSHSRSATRRRGASTVATTAVVPVPLSVEAHTSPPTPPHDADMLLPNHPGAPSASPLPTGEETPPTEDTRAPLASAMTAVRNTREQRLQSTPQTSEVTSEAAGGSGPVTTETAVTLQCSRRPECTDYVHPPPCPPSTIQPSSNPQEQEPLQEPEMQPRVEPAPPRNVG
jgi:hypothetical protein